MDYFENSRIALAESMKTRVMTAYALCAVAESHIKEGELEKALDTVRVIRRLMGEVTRLVEEPQPHSALRETAELLPDLENRVAKLEASLG